MKYETYKPLIKSDDGLEFRFTSIGPNGNFLIAIHFEHSYNAEIVNLSFGNTLPDGNVDNFAKNRNGDRNKILATVVSAVLEFTATYPEKTIVFTGSTPARTRLYRIAISTNYGELSKIFDIYGLQLRGLQICIEAFNKNKDHIGFAVKRKKLNLHI